MNVSTGYIQIYLFLNIFVRNCKLTFWAWPSIAQATLKKYYKMLKKWHKYFHRCMVYKRNFLFHQLLHLQDSQAAYYQRKAGAAAKLFQTLPPSCCIFSFSSWFSYKFIKLPSDSKKQALQQSCRFKSSSTTSGFTSCCIYKLLQLPFDRK